MKTRFNSYVVHVLDKDEKSTLPSSYEDLAHTYWDLRQILSEHIHNRPMNRSRDSKYCHAT